ncbi:MAG TPA: serine/threonine-protein kinase, partial [Polyangiaceae bacterium]|nr:serine/threonine-protein kinase [Polyangiaceae bacterium]
MTAEIEELADGTLEGRAADVFAGTPYRCIEQIGSGGMAEVFIVEHRQLGKRSAIKLLRSQLAHDRTLVDRLRVEYQALGRLNCPNIVATEGVGTTTDGRPYIVMEYVEGHTLEAELSAAEPPSVLETLQIAGFVLCALSEAHAIGIVHRDLKPSNVMVKRKPGGELQVKVLDFGVARILPEMSTFAPRPVEIPTADGVVVGTPRYVSPEGALGQKVDQRADLYGVGILLYLMLTGRGPFDHIDRDTGVLKAHILEEPRPPSDVARNPIPPELDAIVLKALAKNPDDRFCSAQEFLDALLPIWNGATCPSHLRDTGVASRELLKLHGL